MRKILLNTLAVTALTLAGSTDAAKAGQPTPTPTPKTTHNLQGGSGAFATNGKKDKPTPTPAPKSSQNWVIIEMFGSASGGRRATAKPDGHGGYTVDLPGAGSYTIKYANGPKKGQIIKQVTVQKAGPVKVSATALSE